MPTSHGRRGRATNTFVVRVLETDDKGWIGVVSHVQSGRTTNFRGFIEAVRFMDSFINAETMTPGRPDASLPKVSEVEEKGPTPGMGDSAPS